MCIEVHGSSTVFELKKLVCQQPGFVCSDGSCIVLVVKGSLARLMLHSPRMCRLCPTPLLSGVMLDNDTSVADAMTARLPVECAATALVLAHPCPPSLSRSNLGCGLHTETPTHDLRSDASAYPLPHLPIEIASSTSQRVDINEQVSPRAHLSSAAFLTLVVAGYCSTVQHGLRASAGGGVHARSEERPAACCQLHVVSRYLPH